jgi:hypothetical protein
MNLKKTLGIGLAALLTLALLLGLGAGFGSLVAAQTGPPPADHPAGEDHPGPAPDSSPGAPVVVADGKIRELTATGFTLDARQRIVNVTISADTWIVVGGRPPVEGSMESLKVNMGVHVEGTSPADGQIAARVVREMGANPPPARPDAGPGQEGARPNANVGQIHGTVSAVDAANVTLTLENGRTVRFQVNAATIVFRGGFAAVTDLHAGDVVEVVPRLLPASGMKAPGDLRVAGSEPGDGTVPDSAQPGPPAANGVPFASLIWVPGGNDRLIRGRIEKVDGATILMSAPGGLLTVQLSDATAYRRLTDSTTAPTAAAQSDVAVDAPVVVFGSAVAGQEKTIAATAVVVMPKPPAAPSRPASPPDKAQP